MHIKNGIKIFSKMINWHKFLWKLSLFFITMFFCLTGFAKGNKSELLIQPNDIILYPTTADVSFVIKNQTPYTMNGITISNIPKWLSINNDCHALNSGDMCNVDGIVNEIPPVGIFYLSVRANGVQATSIKIEAKNSAVRHVLYIGLDGTTTDAIRLLSSIQNLKIKDFFDHSTFDYGIYAGGNTGIGNAAPTWSAPGWTTLLTGYYPTDSSYPYTSIFYNPATIEDYNSKYTGPNSIFNILGTADVQSFAYGDWSILQAIFEIGKAIYPVPKSIVYSGSETLTTYTINDKKVYDDAITNLNDISKSNNTLTFVYFGSVDEAGHEYGYYDNSPGSQYMMTLIKTSDYIAGLYAEVEKLRKSGEDWLIIFTTDHGGLNNGNHGGRNWKEKQIFSLINDPNTKLPKMIYNQYQGQAAIPATIFSYYDISAPYRNKSIYQPGVGELPVSNGYYYLKLDRQALTDQDLLSINNQTWPGGLDSYRKNIEFALQDDQNIYFFLNDKEFLTYNTGQDKLTSAPQAVTDITWPGLDKYIADVVFGFSSPKTRQIFFFLKDGSYLALNMTDHTFQHAPYIINNQTWPGLSSYLPELKTAFGLANGNIYFITKNDKFLIFNAEQDKVTQPPFAINDQTWPGVALFLENSDRNNVFVPWNTQSNTVYLFLDKSYLD